MSKNVQFHWLIGAAFAALSASPALATEVVVVSVNSATNALNAEQVSQLFLGQRTALPDGQRAVLIDHAEGSESRNNFYARATGRSATQVKALHSRLTFSGAMQPPRVVGNDADVKKAVAEILGGIGYIDKAAVDSSVKVVYTVE